ncbi:Sau3AI family type II restriction endonuclease [Bacillus sp. ST24]|uniref:Sau3AI family type II restriction endonuclease n=1 Tax=Bacillus sp. ST24 TaxID=2978740 RepID=UPI0021D41E7A|nr:Sau3AI family type II restriction endonuclease [Bacillus sp. ST24]
MSTNNAMYDNTNPESIEAHGKLLENKRFHEFLPERILLNKNNKGGLGLLVEEHHFGIQPNNEAAPDFPLAGVELKVTPFKRNASKKKPFSAKERLVLNMINYPNLPNETFSTSSFWKKNKLILLVFYLYETEKDRKDFEIRHAQLFEFPENDLKIIKKDWEIIHNKVSSGKAYDLSESDTYYLAACTKGANSSKRTDAPGKKAKPRAFSLKQSYMTSILNNYVLQGKKTYKTRELAAGQSIIDDLKDETLDEYIFRKYTPYFGRTLNDLCKEFNVNFNSKSYAYLVAKKISAKILNNELDDIDKSEEFVKSNSQIKAIRINKKGIIEQNMSFPSFKYTEIIEETWDTSTMKEYFEEHRFLFVIYCENNNGDYVFRDSFFWRMPTEDLEGHFRNVWEETVTRIKNKQAHMLPKMSENPVAHVRPHGREGIDTYLTHYGESLVKKSFWLHRKYILNQVKKHSHLEL